MSYILMIIVSYTIFLIICLLPLIHQKYEFVIPHLLKVLTITPIYKASAVLTDFSRQAFIILTHLVEMRL